MYPIDFKFVSLTFLSNSNICVLFVLQYSSHFSEPSEVGKLLYKCIHQYFVCIYPILLGVH